MSARAPVVPAMSISSIKHGTDRAWNNGCRCALCMAFGEATMKTVDWVPPAPKPKPKIERRAGHGWRVVIEEPNCLVDFDHIQGAGPTTWRLTPGIIVCHWTGSNGALVTTENTWSFIEKDDVAITAMQECQEEAKRDMPRATVRDVMAASAAAVQRPVFDPRNPPRRTDGIAELKSQMRTLVEQMARFENPSSEAQTEFAKLYGACRDRYRVLRRDFDEVDGMFEAVQAQIIAFMDGD